MAALASYPSDPLTRFRIDFGDFNPEKDVQISTTQSEESHSIRSLLHAIPHLDDIDDAEPHFSRQSRGSRATADRSLPSNRYRHRSLSPVRREFILEAQGDEKSSVEE